MISIEVNGENRNWTDVGPNWVTQQITRRRRDGQTVCVRVRVSELGATWSTPTCGGRGGGGGPVSSEVRHVSELFSQHGLDQDDFSPGSVIAFLRALERLL